jgi:bifunctional UDP-N-acetylglucosamine pyrophosphorylase / glucosamine-1-phosphate N-acetyltransferase
MKKIAVVLAAGKGVRMRSDLPKVAHVLCGKPMVVRVVEVLEQLGLDEIFVVVGYKADIVKEELKGHKVTFVEQKEQLGTGHAVKQARPFINSECTMIVLSGDVPLIRERTLKDLLALHNAKKASVTVLTALLDDPTGYGRIIRNSSGAVEKIVEQKDANPDEAAVKEVNTGTYCFNSKDLFEALDSVKPNNVQKEYYLTDVLGISKNAGRSVHAFTVGDPIEVVGVNTIEELKKLEEICIGASRVQ